MFHGIKYLIVSLVFSHLGFWSGNRFLIAPFPDLCLLVPYYVPPYTPFFYSETGINRGMPIYLNFAPKHIRGGFKKFEEKCCQICNCLRKFTFSVHFVN